MQKKRERERKVAIQAISQPVSANNAIEVHKKY